MFYSSGLGWPTSRCTERSGTDGSTWDKSGLCHLQLVWALGCSAPSSQEPGRAGCRLGMRPGKRLELATERSQCGAPPSRGSDTGVGLFQGMLLSLSPWSVSGRFLVLLLQETQDHLGVCSFLTGACKTPNKILEFGGYCGVICSHWCT